MKKLSIIFSLAAILMGCSKLEEITKPELNEALPEVEMNGYIPQIIYASVAENGDEQTRTYVNGKNVLWHKADEISFFYDHYSNLIMVNNSEDGVSPAEFKPESDDCDELYNKYHNEENFEVKFPKFVYPYNAETVCISNDGVETLVVSYPSEQTYVPNSFGRGANLMVAATVAEKEIDNVYFRNACGYFVIKVKGEGEKIKSIKLTAHGDVKIAGKAHIVASHETAPEVSMTDEATSSVTLNCDEVVTVSADVTEFWFALPPVTFTEGLTIEITDEKGNVSTKSTSNQVVITRNEIQPMKAFQITNWTPSSKQLWYKTLDNKIIDKETFDYSTHFGDPKFQIGETKYFNAKIVEHYFDERLGVCIIEFDEDLTTIKKHAFRAAYLTEVCLPNTVTTIEQSAFTHSSIQIITIPGSVINIGSSAFNECTELWSIKFDASDNNSTLVFEDTDPFKMSRLTDIYINRNISQTSEPTASNLDGMFSRMGHIVCEGNTVVTLGDRVTTIPSFMFRGLPFQKISIPNSVTSIGKGAFYDCTNLESITIPGSVRSIGDDAFNNCTSLSSVTFEGSTEDLYIGRQDETYDKGPFYDSPLTYINLNREIVPVNDGPGGQNAWDEGIFAYSYYDDSNLTTEVILGENVKTISDYMFSGARVQRLNIPGNITSIGYRAFYDCRILEHVKCFGWTAPTLGDEVFLSCDLLSAIAVPGGKDNPSYTSNWSTYKDWIYESQD